MKLTATLKCDRSGRTFDKEIDTTEVAAYEGRQKVREEGLRKVEEFFASFPKEELPDLICVYQGKFQAFINVIPSYNDKAISRLLEQLFHVSDPSTRAEKARTTRNNKKAAPSTKPPEEPKDTKKDGKKGGKSGVQDKAAAT